MERPYFTTCLNCGEQFRISPSRVGKRTHCSRECYNKTKSKDMKGNQYAKGKAAWNKGKRVPQLQNERHGNWRGDAISYDGLHAWVARHKEKIECVMCGSTENLQWSNISYEYKRDLDDYECLCSSCHKVKDLAGVWGAAKERRNNG